jgi:hypothetical protein
VDPWLDNASVTIDGMTWEEASSVAATVTVQLSDEGLAKVQSASLTSQQIVDRKAVNRFLGRLSDHM